MIEREVTVEMNEGKLMHYGIIAPALAAAIVEVGAKVKRLGTDERNAHGGYPYVSVDKFYEIIGPLMADAGLFLMVDELDTDIREHQSKNGPSTWLHMRYELQFVHKSGACGRPVCRSCALPISGPQAFGSAQSYVEKQFLRQVFKIPTGEKDADEVAQDSMPSGRAQRPVDRTKANGDLASQKPFPLRPAAPVAPGDPTTGEILPPHRITLPITADGRMDYVKWGGTFIAALKSAGNYAEWLAWQTENSGFIAECAERAPKASASIKAAIKKTSEQYGEVDETLTEADVEQVLNG